MELYSYHDFWIIWYEHGAICIYEYGNFANYEHDNYRLESLDRHITVHTKRILLYLCNIYLYLSP